MFVLLHHKYTKRPAALSWPKAAQTELPEAVPFLDDSFCSSMSFWLSLADKLTAGHLGAPPFAHEVLLGNTSME